MARPIIIVNCKTYPQATGKNALRLARLCEAIAKKTKADIRIAVQATDLAIVAKAVRIPVYAQHADPAMPGQSTGWTTAYAIKAAGAKGTLLNHAERRLDDESIRRTAGALKEAKLDIVICAEHADRLREIDGITDATMLCYEPPELIGGDISVSMSRPEIVTRAVASTKRPVLIGAGIKTAEDLRIALSLGAKGVLIASGIVLAKDQRKALTGLLAI